MQRTATSIAALLLLILAVAFQIPQIRDMAANKAHHILRHSTPLANPIRRFLPHYRSALPAAFHPTLFTPIQQIYLPSARTASAMAESKSLPDAISSRRSYYQMTTESTISDARIKELIAHTIKHVPSAFNSQTTRMVVVLKEKHEELWDAIMEVYKVQLPAEKFEHAKGRMVGFRKAYGTVSLKGNPRYVTCWTLMNLLGPLLRRHLQRPRVPREVQNLRG